VSTITLQGHSLRRFGALERQKFKNAVGHAMDISPEEVNIVAVTMGGEPVVEDLRQGFRRVQEDLSIEYEVVLKDETDLMQHTLRLNRLTHSGEMQRILQAHAGMSSKALVGWHVIKRLGS